MIDISSLTEILAYVFYTGLALIALWGAFCVALAWLRAGQKQFGAEAAQEAFLGEVESALNNNDLAAAELACQNDARALPQLAALAIAHRAAGFERVRQLLIERFQRDVMADLDYRLSWINTVIKAAPMIGLLGTVVGMMGAFGKLSAGGDAQATNNLAADIMLALTTTACGLAIAIPLVLAVAAINVRIKRLEDLVAAGLTRFLEAFRRALMRGAGAVEAGGE